MTFNYRADDPILSRWSGLNRKLTNYEIDLNFYQHAARLSVLEAGITTTVSISTITQPTSSTLLFTMTDSSTQGPFTMPTPTFVDRGAWAISTVYAVNDTFTANGSLYRVLFAHTSSATSFSPTANDGAGHDYYAAMLSSPGNALPAGGAANMFLRKSTGSDYVVSWAFPLPNGGAAHQVLMKASSADQDYVLGTLSSAYVSFAPSTASGLVSTNVSAALEELAALVGTGGGSSALSGLTDVLFATGEPAAGDLLYYDGFEWVPRTLANAGSLSTSQLRNLTITALGTLSSVAMDLTLGDVFTLTPTVSMTLSTVYVPPGGEITLIITTSGTTSYTITFGSNIKSQGTLATGTVSGKVFAVKFVGDGVNLNEVSRTAAM